MINFSDNNKILDFLKKNNFKFFFLFVFISSFFWIVTKFSNVYKFKNDFHVKWINIPDTISVNNQQKKISVLFSASGFEILLYKLYNKNIEISLDSDVVYENNTGTVNVKQKKYEFEKQLFDNNKIENIISKRILFNYSILSRKKVPVLLEKTISFRPGYLNEDDFSISPDSIFVIGPTNIVDTLSNIITKRFEKNDIYKSIDEDVDVLLIDNLKYGYSKIRLSSIVRKYSEKEFKIPIKIINLPDSVKIKLFPNYIKLNATINLDDFNDIDDKDFTIIANYKLLNSNYSSLSLFLTKNPRNVKNINWYPKTVNYLIRK